MTRSTPNQILCALLVLSCLLALAEGFSTMQPSSLASTRGNSRRSAGEGSLLLLEKKDSAVEIDSEEETTCAEPLTQGKGDLPTVLQQIADERQQFNMALGRAMDTLRKDMPEILRSSPDYSIYHPDIEVIDPSGVRLNGLDNYKSAISFFQTFIKFWFSPSSRLQYRMAYDFSRSSIRVSWNIVLIPKVPLGRPIFLDGVSHYKLSSVSGKIIEHKIENLVMNDTPVAPPYGIFSILQQEVMPQRQPVPVGAGAWSCESS